MRIVADTNVLVSAIVFGGPPGEVVELAAAQLIQLVISPARLDELREVLERKFGFSGAALYQSETLLRRPAIVAEPATELSVIAEDPADNRVLEAAAAGNVDAIVSGDRHLLSLKAFGGVPIVTPRELLKKPAGTG